MSRARGRREPFNRAQATQRLGYARKCDEVATLIGADPDDAYAAKVAVSIYVLAGIAAAQYSPALVGTAEEKRAARASEHLIESAASALR